MGLHIEKTEEIGKQRNVWLHDIAVWFAPAHALISWPGEIAKTSFRRA